MEMVVLKGKSGERFEEERAEDEHEERKTTRGKSALLFPKIVFIPFAAPPGVP